MATGSFVAGAWLKSKREEAMLAHAQPGNGDVESIAKERLKQLHKKLGELDQRESEIKAKLDKLQQAKPSLAVQPAR